MHAGSNQLDHHHHHRGNCMNMPSKISEPKVEIISRQNVKPSTPTSPHLKIYKLSILDQLNSQEYFPTICFYRNDDNISGYSSRVILKRRQLLKKSLSRVLSRFYPLAGEISQDCLHIECNDNGVYYVEARVESKLQNFLRQPEHDQIDRLLPIHPGLEGLLAEQTYLVMVQISIFDCGGLAVAVQANHKLVDGSTHITLLKEWAAEARGSPETARSLLDFHSDSSRPSPAVLFPQDPTLPKDPSSLVWLPNLMMNREGKRINSSRRFVFDAFSLVELKNRTRVTRVLAVTSLIWKCAMAASKKRWGYQKPSVLTLPVNLRLRASSSSFPPDLIGNIIWDTYAHAMPNDDGRIDLDCVVGSLRDCLAPIDGLNFVKRIQGEKGTSNIRKMLQEYRNNVRSVGNDVDYFLASSLCNGGMYGTDFGWGEPIWLSTAGLGVVDSVGYDQILMIDTKSGGGIEAWVTLDEPNMKILEKDPELLAFAWLDPSPLQIIEKPVPRSYL